MLAKLTIWLYSKPVKSRPYGLTHTDYPEILFITVFAVMLRSSRICPHWRLSSCFTYYLWEVSYLLNFWLCHREIPNFIFGRCRGCPTERLSWFYSVLLTTARILPWAAFDISLYSLPQDSHRTADCSIPGFLINITFRIIPNWALQHSCPSFYGRKAEFRTVRHVFTFTF